MKIAAGIITFNPNISRLKKSIQSIANQVDVIYIYDNNSSNINYLVEYASGIQKINLICGKKNIGVASGLNQIVRTCSDDNIKWLLTLDQDSICPVNLISSLVSAITDNCAVICPRSVDRRLAYKNEFNNKLKYKDREDVDRCITAGSLVNLDVCNFLGGFDDFLFIDFVDYEYCFRLKANGYRIIRVNTVVLEQEFGDMTISKHSDFYLRFGRFFRSPFIMRFALKKQYSSMRKYYTIRNLWYCSKKYPQVYSEMLAWKLSIELIIKVFIFADNRFDVIPAIIKAIKDGRRLDILPYKSIR